MAKRALDNVEQESRKRLKGPSNGTRSIEKDLNGPDTLPASDDLARNLRRVQVHKGSSDDEAGSRVSSDSDSDSDNGEPNVESNISSIASAMEDSDGQTPESEVSASSGCPCSDLTETKSDVDPSDPEVGNAAADISFGALAKAQASLGSRKRSNHDRSPQEVQVNEDAEALERQAGKKDAREFARTSKHAPTEISAKKAVSRKRSVVPIHKIDVRDPRFEHISGKVNENQVKKNYAFLSTYRDTEIAELKAGLRKTKDAKARETLKQALTSMESRKRTEQLSEQRQEVLRQHRKEEKGKVKAGKQPFYLKRSEIKEKALTERFKGMKAKEKGKAIERRRKKITAKERKAMPVARRG